MLRSATVPGEAANRSWSRSRSRPGSRATGLLFLLCVFHSPVCVFTSRSLLI